METSSTLLTVLGKDFENISLSHATMRTQDLIPVFMDFVKTHNLPAYETILNDYNLIEDFFWPEDDHKFWDSDDAHYLLNETLWDELSYLAPENCYFGSHEGDGSDYGFWKLTEQDYI